MNIKRFIKFSWSKSSKNENKETITKGELIINNYREIFLVTIFIGLLIAFWLYLS